MGKQLDRDVLIDHLRRMMEARQIDRLPKSGYAKAIEDVAGCPTVDGMMTLNDTISAFRCCTLAPPRCSKCPLTDMCKGSLSKDRCKTEVKRSVNHWLTSQEPKRGRWIPHPESELWDVCSVCGIGCKRRERDNGAETEYSYWFCPNCGARLEDDADGQES